MLQKLFVVESVCLFLFVLANAQVDVKNVVEESLETATQYVETPEPVPIIQNTMEVPEVEISGDGVEEAIQRYEHRANIADKTSSQGVLPEDEIEKLFESMVEPLQNIMKLMKVPTNVYKFIEAKGIERVILPHLHIFHTDLRTHLLDLTKLLFDVAPTTTSVMIPPTILDKLLDIFEDDDNLALKARTVEILFIWLPDNPKIQARVMKLKGLEPFYDQVHKLDATVIHTLLKLFNKILSEHIKVRNEYAQKSKNDLIKTNIYKKIGLVEHVATKSVCHGLLNIFQSTWAYSLTNRDYMLPVFEILKNVEPYCVEHYKGKAKALELFQTMQQQMSEGGLARNAYESLGLNATDIQLVLRKYLEGLSTTVKDEF